MLAPTAILRAARSPPATNNATLRKPTTNFLRFIFQPDPEPVNCCTQNTTKDYLEDRSHPYHIKTGRRVAAFDPNKLHTSVVAHIDVSKKRVVRSWVTRRVRVALKAELQSRGWGPDGSMLGEKKGRDEQTGLTYARSPIRGALKIYMATDRRKEIVTATGEEVRREVRGIVKEVVRRQARPVRDSSLGGMRRGSVRGGDSGDGRSGFTIRKEMR